MAWWIKEGKSKQVNNAKEECPHGDESGSCTRCEMTEVYKPITNVTVLTDTDVKFIVTSFPEKVLSLLKENPEEVLLAGGYIRAMIAGESVSDIDLFVKSESLAKDLAKEYFTQPALTDSCYLYTQPGQLPIQLIFRWDFDNPTDLMDAFDLTIAQAAIWYQDFEFHSMCSTGFYPDLAGKRLVYTHPGKGQEGAGHVARILKFNARGYTTEADSLAGLLADSVCSLKSVNASFEEVYKELFDSITKMRQGKKPSMEELSKPVYTRAKRIAVSEAAKKAREKADSYSYS